MAWFVAWTKKWKTREPHWGLMQTRRPKDKKLPEYEGVVFQRTHFYEEFATEAEAQRRCDELKAKETDPRCDYVPFSKWKMEAMDLTCGIRPWTTREEDLESIEFSKELHASVAHRSLPVT
jgi:hypothetical protein